MATRVAARVQRRSRRVGRRLVRAPRRSLVGAHRARRRRGTARVPERVPTPRQPAVRGRGRGAHAAAVPVPPLDVGPPGPAPRGAVTQDVRGAAQRRLPPRPGAGRHLGPARVREPRPRSRRGPTRRVPRRRACRHRVGASRRVPLPGDRAHPGGVQLEGRRGGLLGELPRAGHPSGAARVGRRRERPATHLRAALGALPGLRRTQPPSRRRRIRRDGVGVVRVHAGRPRGHRPCRRRAGARDP